MGEWIYLRTGEVAHFLPDGAERTLCGRHVAERGHVPGGSRCARCAEAHQRARFGAHPRYGPDDVGVSVTQPEGDPDG